MTSFFFGPFDWDTWAGFDHKHADNPWDNDIFRIRMRSARSISS
jgi:hypothetical protein